MEGGGELLTIWAIRVLFVIVSSLVGYFCSSHLHIQPWQGLLSGLSFAIVLVVIERLLKLASLKDLLGSTGKAMSGLQEAILNPQVQKKSRN